jgi:lysophospholipase L1-like esterase
VLVLVAALVSFAAPLASASPEKRKPDSTDPPRWVEPMRKVHSKFTGRKGTFALFGDSITVSMAFWAGLPHDRKHMPRDGEKAFDLVNDHMLKECWAGWRGPRFGNDGGQTIRWAHQNIDQWLKDHNPETALIMFGTNDLNGVPLDEYDRKYREVVRKCLDNGTVVLLTTIPPRSGKLDQSRQLAEAVRKIGREMNVPVVDYFAEILKRRPDDWDGSLPKFKDPADRDVYNVPTLISRDGVHPSSPKEYAGDYSEEGLKSNGYVLRNYVTLLGYAEVIRNVLKAE